MPFPTEAALRQFLQDLGLPQVDPRSWFIGTLPEKLSASVQLGRIAPTRNASRNVRTDHSTPAIAAHTFTLEVPPPDEVWVVHRMYVEMLTAANINRIEFEVSPVHLFWKDESGPFAVAPYIGTDNTATPRFHSMNPHGIQIFGSDVHVGGDALRMTVANAVADVKTLRTIYRVDEYKLQDFPGW